MRLLKLVPEDTNIKFLKLRVPFYGVSILLIIASWGLVLTQGLNYGVDFAGGQEVRVTFEDLEEAPIQQLRDELGGLGYDEPTIQRFGDANSVSIRIQLPEGAEDQPGAANATGEEVVGQLQSEFENVHRDANETVSGKVAGEFRERSVWALLGAMLAISLYIWVRFEWQFGVGALSDRFASLISLHGFARLITTHFAGPFD